MDDDISAVVLRIDSPGGSIMASEVIRREVAALRAAGKPVVASMGTVAASGGYYIAMDADKILAAPTTITGSIGVFAVIPTFQRTLDKIGVTNDGFGTTRLSGQSELDRGARARRQGHPAGLGRARVPEFRRERRRGAQAPLRRDRQPRAGTRVDRRGRQGAGIIDDLGNVDDAIAEAAKLAKLGDDYDVRWMEQETQLARRARHAPARRRRPGRECRRAASR